MLSHRSGHVRRASLRLNFSGPLIQAAQYDAMLFTPEQYRRIAEAYESASADHIFSPAQRRAFTHKAEWYRMLSRLGSKPKWAMPTHNPLSQKAETNPGVRPSLMSARFRSLFAWQQRR